MKEEQIFAILRALSVPTRVDIMRRIAAQGDECICASVLQEMPIAQSTFSHHVSELVAAGLVDMRPEGRVAKLSVNHEVYRSFLELMPQFVATTV